VGQLLRACGQPAAGEAWKEFMRRYHPLLTTAAIRVSRRWGNGTPDEIDDVLQEIYLKLCADGAQVLTSFHVDAPDAEFGYFKVVATNLAHDYFRKRSAAKRGVFRTESLDEARGVAAGDSEMEKRLVLSEVDNALLSHTQSEHGSRDRGIFRLYYQHGMTSKAIAELPGVDLSQKGVEGVLQRLTKSIRQTLQPQQESDRN
jgi:RNA polymerase sigma-70 factor (ECF subfamily)